MLIWLRSSTTMTESYGTSFDGTLNEWASRSTGNETFVGDVLLMHMKREEGESLWCCNCFCSNFSMRFTSFYFGTANPCSTNNIETKRSKLWTTTTWHGYKLLYVNWWCRVSRLIEVSADPLFTVNGQARLASASWNFLEEKQIRRVT